MAAALSSPFNVHSSRTCNLSEGQARLGVLFFFFWFVFLILYLYLLLC